MALCLQQEGYMDLRTNGVETRMVSFAITPNDPLGNCELPLP